MVQPDQGLRVYSSIERRQGCVRSHLSGSAGGAQHPERGTGGRVRTRQQSRQNVRGEPQGRVSGPQRVFPVAPGSYRGFFVALAQLASLTWVRPSATARSAAG